MKADLSENWQPPGSRREAAAALTVAHEWAVAAAQRAGKRIALPHQLHRGQARHHWRTLASAASGIKWRKASAMAKNHLSISGTLGTAGPHSAPNRKGGAKDGFR